MITKEEYEKAKKVIEEFKKQEYDKLPYVKGTYFCGRRLFEAIKYKDSGKIFIFDKSFSPWAESKRIEVLMEENDMYYFKEI